MTWRLFDRLALIGTDFALMANSRAIVRLAKIVREHLERHRDGTLR